MMKEQEPVHSPVFFENYYQRTRTDILKLIPSGVKTVLSVGCAEGCTEAELVQRGVCVYGIEINPQASRRAEERGVIIVGSDASEVDVSHIEGEFDYIIYADVLEHLVDPESVLERHVKKLRPGGSVYVCVPNFRHYSIFWNLFVRGFARYRDAGILDRTHLRITTRKMVCSWFNRVGLKVCRSDYHIYKRRFQWLSWCTFGLLREFLAHQVSLVASKPKQ